MTTEVPRDVEWRAAVMATVDALARGVRSVLGDAALGMYVHGSLASGDFNVDRSDIDVLVLSDGDVRGDGVAGLAAMHERIVATHPPWGAGLEVVYLPADELGRPAPRSERPVPQLHVDEGFLVRPIGPGFAIQLHVVRERGRMVFGADPKRLIPAITAETLQQAQVELLERWWLPRLPAGLRLADPAHQAYAVLTMCRARYLLATGAIASKSVAASWALDHLDARWHGLIRQALM